MKATIQLDFYTSNPAPGVYFGRCEQYSCLHHTAPNEKEALLGIQFLTLDFVADQLQDNECCE